MPLQLPGDPQKNIDFYAGVLGLRLVKPGKTSAEVAPDHEDISELSLTGSPSRFLGVFRLLPRFRNTRFHR